MLYNDPGDELISPLGREGAVRFSPGGQPLPLFREVDSVNEKELWEKCAAFHGHVCGGLTIGYKAALYAVELLELTFSEDEQVVCIPENDACGVDAIQVILGCTVGKGNLLFHMTGKQAFSFYNRQSGRSVRLMLKEKPGQMTREQSLTYYQNLAPEDMFDAMPTRIPLPERAKIFKSWKCDSCGEIAGDHWMRLQGDKRLCRDCFKLYDRFEV